MFYPDRAEYRALSRNFNLVPVYKELPADLDTPISVYLKVVRGGPSFLLESVEGGENLARYSFIGCDPFLTAVFADGDVRLAGRGEKPAGILPDPFKGLASLMKHYRVPLFEDLPRFHGGAVGYLGYDAIRFIEELPGVAADSGGLIGPAMPEGYFMFPTTVLIFDHVKRSLKVVVNSQPSGDPAAAYEEAVSRIAGVERALAENVSPVEKLAPAALQEGGTESNMSRAEFMARVEKAKEYIAAGDILQVVLSQRFKVPYRGDLFQAYRRLRAINPSPYLYFLDFGDITVAGSSPEMLIRVEGDTVETCPIAGTRPRGRDEAQDTGLAAELLSDEKERAEHLMLVDLGRNDLGRVCLPGSVKLTRFMEVEKYSHVMHLVSKVTGRLLPGETALAALASCFPAGTVSGAPKVRAMQIIDELEPNRRGIYAGAVGYCSFTGNLDTAIAIRTVFSKGGYAYVQAGAGIVADSIPEKEFEETLSKAGALLKVLEDADREL